MKTQTKFVSVVEKAMRYNTIGSLIKVVVYIVPDLPLLLVALFCLVAVTVTMKINLDFAGYGDVFSSHSFVFYTKLYNYFGHTADC